MADQAARHRDTFFVRPSAPSDRGADKAALSIDTLTLPGGQRVHALEREVFEKAVRDAMKGTHEHSVANARTGKAASGR